MPTGQAQTLGEVARRLDEVFQRYEQIANDLPKTFVTKELFEARQEVLLARIEAAMAQHVVLQKQVEDLEDDKKWLYRLIVGAVILALLGLLFSIGHSVTSSGSSKNPAKTSSVVVSRQ